MSSSSMLNFSSFSASKGKLGTEKIVDNSSILSCGSSAACSGGFFALFPLMTDPNIPYCPKAIWRFSYLCTVESCILQKVRNTDLFLFFMDDGCWNRPLFNQYLSIVNLGCKFQKPIAEQETAYSVILQIWSLFLLHLKEKETREGGMVYFPFCLIN